MILIQSIITKSDLDASGININSELTFYYKMKHIVVYILYSNGI